MGRGQFKRAVKLQEMLSEKQIEKETSGGDISREHISGADTQTPCKNRFQVIVVGAGMAGITAALFLARAGVEVLLLERGPYPGSKSVSGGAIYALSTRELLGEFWQEAPLERALVDHQYWLMAPDSAVKMGFKSMAYNNPPYNRFSILRADFDRWYASKAVEAGAVLWTGCKGEDLLFEGKKILGIRVSGSYEGELYTDLVIMAEGANPLVAERAGLVPKPSSQNMGLYVKETLYLPEETINERFQLKRGEGAVIGLLGDATAGIIGTGSIYTYKSHIGINLGISVKTLVQKRVRLSRLMARVKAHPVIEPLLSGAKTVEYVAHMIPEGGYNAVPQVVFDGGMLTGDSASFVNGTHGINLAMYSGRFAADTAIQALKHGDLSAKGLKGYWDKLDKSFILQDLKDNRNVPELYQKNPTLFTDYINLLNQVSMQITTVYPVTRKAKRGIIRKQAFGAVPPGKMLMDMYKTFKVIR